MSYWAVSPTTWSWRMTLENQSQLLALFLRNTSPMVDPTSRPRREQLRFAHPGKFTKEDMIRKSTTQETSNCLCVDSILWTYCDYMRWASHLQHSLPSLSPSASLLALLPNAVWLWVLFVQNVSAALFVQDSAAYWDPALPGLLLAFQIWPSKLPAR